MDWTKKITIKQLRTLRAIVETGSLAQGAYRMGISPPAVTIQLKKIEEEIGGKVLDRGHEGLVKITSIGEELILLGTQLDTSLNYCFKKINSLKKGNRGFVVLGVVSTAQYFSPWIVAKARKAMPNIEIDIFVGNRSEVIKALEMGGIDLAIMGRPPRTPMVNAKILGNHPHVLIASTNHNLANGCDNLSNFNSREIRNILKNETFLIREPGSGTRILFERFLESVGLYEKISKKELSSNEVLKQAVMAGLGIALISASTIKSELKNASLCTLDFQGLPIIRQWFLVHKTERSLSSTATQFQNFILSKNWLNLITHK